MTKFKDWFKKKNFIYIEINYGLDLNISKYIFMQDTQWQRRQI